MINQLIEKQCTGCTACKNICPKNAIKMLNDREGFWYPSVDDNMCIKCGLCKTVCPIINKSERECYHNPEVYAAWNKNDDIRIKSTSGGVFFALAQNILKMDGVVVGAQYNSEFAIQHVVVDKIDDLAMLRQSKYAQSDLGDVFQIIKEYLEQKRLVLFCGTPCQSAGLQNFLQKQYSNFYSCDFICRGVISPKVYKKFLDDIGKEHNGSKLKSVQFKNKDFGWNKFSTKLVYEDGSLYQKKRSDDYYMKGYLQYNLYLRPSCHECFYKQLPRISDISLGDFWGIGKYNAVLDNDKGTSVVLINSKKGKQLLEWMKDELVIERRTLEEVLAGNSCLLNSAPVGEFRTYFFENMKKKSFQKLIKKIERKAEHLSLTQRFLRSIHRIKVTILNR